MHGAKGGSYAKGGQDSSNGLRGAFDVGMVVEVMIVGVCKREVELCEV